MSLQRRLLIFLLCVAPILWSVALGYAVDRSHHEVNELFDTELIRLARQVHISLPESLEGSAPEPRRPDLQGEADLKDLALAVWAGDGERKLVDREGALLPYLPHASGFRDVMIAGDPWRVYYLQSGDGGRIVAAGQRQAERGELVSNLLVSQILPWVLALPALLLAIVWGVRQAMRPVHRLAEDLNQRAVDDPRPLRRGGVPIELQPMVEAVNRLVSRSAEALDRERRLTSNAAHELRTPLAALTMQWERLTGADSAREREEASRAIASGLSRMSRLVSQLLDLHRIEALGRASRAETIDWSELLRQAIEDCLPVADRRGIEFECIGADSAATAFPMQGDPDMLGAMLRNLSDNAARYATPGTLVRIRLEPDRLSVSNVGPPLGPELQLALGQRFIRPAGQQETGSGLGLSIACLIAQAHGLELRFDDAPAGDGVVATVADPLRADRPQPISPP